MYWHRAGQIVTSSQATAWLFAFFRSDTLLNNTISKSRERAELAFGKTQSQFLARNRLVAENDAVVQARDEKTLRLRELRKAKEASDLAAGIGAKPTRAPKG
jgi:hypothetical protein